jgi:hypothetical protein
MNWGPGGIVVVFVSLSNETSAFSVSWCSEMIVSGQALDKPHVCTYNYSSCSFWKGDSIQLTRY